MDSRKLQYLQRGGFIEEKANVYEVLKQICGSHSGTAAIVQGQDGPASPNGYNLWKFYDQQSINDAG